LEAWTVDLALEDAQLVAEREDLGEQGVIGLPALDEGVEQGADQGVEDSQEHGQRIMTAQAGPDARPLDRVRSSAGCSATVIVLLEQDSHQADRRLAVLIANRPDLASSLLEQHILRA